MNTPTENSVRRYRKLGYVVKSVTYWNPWAKVRVDLCGCDLMFFGPLDDGIGLIQTTTQSNRAARENKLIAIKEVHRFVMCGGKIRTHGWMQPAGSRIWKLDERELQRTEDGMRWFDGPHSDKGGVCEDGDEPVGDSNPVVTKARPRAGGQGQRLSGGPVLRPVGDRPPKKV